MNWPQQLLARAEKVHLLLVDVDGVLTDGTLLYSGDGGESKTFNTRDGFGLKLLGEAGISCGVITARSSEMVAKRAAELGMRHVRQGARDKIAAFTEILDETGLSAEQTAYMGDDWLDLKLLGLVGLAAAPADAEAEVLQAVHFISPRKGGHGAVRDLCSLLLTAKGVYHDLLCRHRN